MSRGLDGFESAGGRGRHTVEYPREPSLRLWVCPIDGRGWERQLVLPPDRHFAIHENKDAVRPQTAREVEDERVVVVYLQAMVQLR